MERSERQAELEKNKQRELAKMATRLGIKGAHDMRKADVIEAILEVEILRECLVERSAGDNKIDDQSVAEAVTKDEKETASTVAEDKLQYIQSAEIGTIVAFRNNNKVRSAKIVKRSTKNRRLMLETQYGAQYIVSYDDIVWVRTGAKWPRGVYKLLKGEVSDAHE